MKIRDIKKFLPNIIPAVVVLLLLGGFLIYSFIKISELNEEIVALNTKISTTTEAISNNLSSLRNETVGISNTLSSTQQNIDQVKNEVGGVQEKVGDLEKLSETDPELLQKYSKVFFLNEHYAPPRLLDIQNKNKYFEERDLEIHFKVKPHLEDMLNSALGNGIEIYVLSAYRSFDSQQELKGQYSVVYGEGTANQFSADQGYSEHQLGTTVDLITTGIGGTLEGFGETAAYTWLLDNAHKYGFTLSYPKNNQFYIFEPWHWRFVGVELATFLKNQNLHFYDLEQREIDEHLIKIFD